MSKILLVLAFLVAVAIAAKPVITTNYVDGLVEYLGYGIIGQPIMDGIFINLQMPMLYWCLFMSVFSKNWGNRYQRCMLRMTIAIYS